MAIIPWLDSVPNLSAIEQSAADSLRVQHLTTFNMSRVAFGSWISFTKFELHQPIRSWLKAFFAAGTLCHAVILTSNPLTLKVCGTSCVTWSKNVLSLSEIEQSPAELLMILIIFAPLVALWSLSLTSWPWTRVVNRVSCDQTTNFERDRSIRGLVINDLPIWNSDFSSLFCVFFSAPHGMPARTRNEKGVCPSVRPSNAWIVTKRKKIYPYFYTIRKIIYPIVFWEEWVGGRATPSTGNFGSTDPSEIADVEPIFSRIASAVTPSEKS